MEYDKLVNTIVQEVLKNFNENSFKNANKKIAVIFNKDDLQRYSNIMGSEYEIVLYEENIKECSVVVITKLCLKAMANLANLLSSTKEESFIINMLMEGKKIYIAEEGLIYKKYKNSAPKQVYNKYLEFENTLKNYGIEIMSNSLTTIQKVIQPSSIGGGDCLNIITTMGVKSPSEVVNNSIEDDALTTITKDVGCKEQCTVINKRLITEADVKKQYLMGNKIISIDNGSVITPLAKDYIKMNHIEILK